MMELLHTVGTCLIIFIVLPSLPLEIQCLSPTACGSIMTLASKFLLDYKSKWNIGALFLSGGSIIAAGVLVNEYFSVDISIVLCFIFGAGFMSFGFWQTSFASKAAVSENSKLLKHFGDVSKHIIIDDLRNRLMLLTTTMKIIVILIFYIVLVNVRHDHTPLSYIPFREFWNGSWWICILCGFVGSTVGSYICQMNLVRLVYFPALLLSTPLAFAISYFHEIILTHIQPPMFQFDSNWHSSINGAPYGFVPVIPFVICWLFQYVSVRDSIFSLHHDHFSEHRRLFHFPKLCFHAEALEQFLLFMKRIDRDFYDQHILMREQKVLKRCIERGIGSVRRNRERIQNIQNSKPHVYCCGTMWHETTEEMKSLLRSLFRLDADRDSNKGKTDEFVLESHIFFDDAFSKSEVKVDETSETDELRELKTKYTKVCVVPNSFVKDFFRCMKDLGKDKMYEVKHITKQLTPYGAKLTWTLPKGTHLIVHLKDKCLIRHKKRWSQIMYIQYILNYCMGKRCQGKESKRRDEFLKNTFILALDGDVDFQPEAVHQVIDTLKSNHKAGACCGVIKPLGSGMIFWYQKFEYAVGHWLQKAAEHFLGSVLCSPGCFSLLRASALVDDDVAERYSSLPDKPEHYIQYDQGEDRWLCTLLIQKGWRVTYNPNSISYTNAPEEFDEFYNQRRRWGPSTLANVVDLIRNGGETVKNNDNISSLYMLYQVFLLIISLIGPSTILMVIMQNLSYVVSLEFKDGKSQVKTNAKELEYIVLIVVISLTFAYVILCRYLPSKAQIVIAKFLTIVFSLIMMVVIGGLIASMRDTFFSNPQNLFVCLIAFIFIMSAVLHGDIGALLCGVIYIFLIPSMYLFLTIFGFSNLNNVSWGTREVTTTLAEDPKKAEAKKMENQSVMNQITNLLPKNINFLSKIGSTLKGLCMCCSYSTDPELVNEVRKINAKLEELAEKAGKTEYASKLDPLRASRTSDLSNASNASRLDASIRPRLDQFGSSKLSLKRTLVRKPFSTRTRLNTESETAGEQMNASERQESIVEVEEEVTEIVTETLHPEEEDQWRDRRWIDDDEMTDDAGRPIFDNVKRIDFPEEEERFFHWLIREKLHPLVETGDTRAKKEAELAALRDKVCFSVYLLNALWLIFIIVLQGNRAAQINIPLDLNPSLIGLGFSDPWKFDVINSVMMILFGVLAIVQFVAMLAVKWDSLKRMLARTSVPNPCGYFRKNDGSELKGYDNKAFTMSNGHVVTPE